MRIAAPLLALLGHELRAPVGVVGGYLALLEQSQGSLTPDQQNALAGARKAQQSLVESLDDLRRLTISWRAEDEPLTWVALSALAPEVRSLAVTRGVPLTIDTADTVALPRRGRDTTLADALVTVGEAVAREHGAPVRATTTVRGRTLVWRVRPHGATSDAAATRREFDLWRAGLGVRLVAAAVTISASHGTLDDLVVGEARHGVDVTFDLDAKPAPPPLPVDAG
jgi:light-regulated signal transduction histidine kinase (bacteriophytochrome)